MKEDKEKYIRRQKQIIKKFKSEKYKPKPYDLYENGRFIDTFPSHAAAKKKKHFLIVEAYQDMLDLDYEIKPHKI